MLLKLAKQIVLHHMLLEIIQKLVQSYKAVDKESISGHWHHFHQSCFIVFDTYSPYDLQSQATPAREGITWLYESTLVKIMPLI